ncbi:MAG: VOC family protein, partial [Pseudonocardiaceae bacterium]
MARTSNFSIGHLVSNKDQVDALPAQARAAGATHTQKARNRPWGIYAGYFRDPDGHPWEIIWNPERVPQTSMTWAVPRAQSRSPARPRVVSLLLANLGSREHSIRVEGDSAVSGGSACAEGRRCDKRWPARDAGP